MPITRRKRLARNKPLRRYSRPRQRRKGDVAAQKREADRLFSKIIRTRDPLCCVCITRETTDCAHHLSRIYQSVRWDLDNASGTCRGCHMYMTAHPLQWQRWWQIALGPQAAVLLAKATKTGDWDPAILDVLRAKALELGVE